jgi:FkbM family methyltransferase
MSTPGTTRDEQRVDIRLAGRSITLTGDPGDSYFQALEAFSSQSAPLLRYLQTHIERDALCLDVGANISLVSIMLALCCPDGEVHSFEGSPRNARYLKRNLALNGIENCFVTEVAVGAREGRTRFRETPFAAGSHVAPGDPDTDLPASVIAVPTVTIDGYCRERLGRKIDFMKLDVEGSEPAVLAGARHTIERDRCPIYMEFNSWCLLVYQNFNPLAFASSILATFDVERIDAAGAVVPAGDGAVGKFLHANLVEHGCVDDVLLRLKPGASVPSLDEMTKCGDDLDNLRELRRLRAERSVRPVAWQGT